MTLRGDSFFFNWPLVMKKKSGKGLLIDFTYLPGVLLTVNMCGAKSVVTF